MATSSRAWLQATVSSAAHPELNVGISVPLSSQEDENFWTYVMADAFRMQRALLRRDPYIDLSKVDWTVEAYDR
jgi:hypothetical protein